MWLGRERAREEDMSSRRDGGRSSTGRNDGCESAELEERIEGDRGVRELT